MTTNIKRRWANGLGYNHNNLMKRAIKKYGWENIEHNVLFENLSKEEAEQKEIELIKLYECNKLNYGYNISNGGNHLGKHSQQSKEKMRNYALNRPLSHNKNISLSKKGKPSNMTKEQKKLLSDILKGNKYGVGNKSFLGKKHSEESKKKISLSRLGKTSWIKGKKRSLQHTLNNVETHKKKVVQYDKNMNIICEFSSIKEAIEKTKINNICKCCKGKQKTAGGYIWKYKIKDGLVEKVEE
jgi:group I intron endonuclease